MDHPFLKFKIENLHANFGPKSVSTFIFKYFEKKIQDTPYNPIDSRNVFLWTLLEESNIFIQISRINLMMINR